MSAENERGAFGIVPKRVFTDKSISLAAKGLLGFLACYCGAERECFPSRTRILDELDISKDYLGKLLGELIGAGVLEVVHVKDHGKFARNVYRLKDLPCPVPPDTVSPDTVSPGTVSPGTVSQDTKNTTLKEKQLLKNTYRERTSSPAPSPAKKEKQFSPPTVEEVLVYCRERSSTVDAEAFVAFYESKGWMVGKSPMKDWKAAVRTWEQRDRENGKRAVPAENDPDEVMLPF